MILVVSKSKRNAERISESLNIMGYLSYGTTVSDAIKEISPRYRALILISDTTSLYPPFDSVIKSASAPALKIPVFILGNGDDKRAAAIFSGNVSVAFMIKRIIRYLSINEKPMIGKYKCAGFDASSDLLRIMYFDTYTPLTKTEKMILRFLCRSYPLPQSAKDIIKYAVRPSRSPEPSSIRSHISSMNKKFKSTIGRPMIEFYQRDGYIIITPETKREILK